MKRQKGIKIILIVCFLALIAGLPVSWYLKPEEERAENSENRVLSEFPSVESAEELETLPQAFETWFSDHLPYKEALVEIKSGAELSLFRELHSDQVILGTEIPWLFYKANDGQAIETYKRTNQFSDENLTRIREVLYSLQTQLYEGGTDFVLMIVPDKETIYGPDYMPPEIKVMEEKVHRTDQFLQYMKEQAPDIKILYPKEELLSAKAEQSEGFPLYYESDTHWNRLGARVGADALFNLLAENDRGYLTPYRELRFSNLADADTEGYAEGELMRKKGDMQNLCKLPEAFDSTEYRVSGTQEGDLIFEIKSPSDERVYEQYVSRDPECAKRSLYIAADSFRWNLTGFVKGRAEESVILSRYYLDLADVTEKHPDTFVYMIAERYLHELEGLPGVAAPALQFTDEFKKSDIY